MDVLRAVSEVKIAVLVGSLVQAFLQAMYTAVFVFSLHRQRKNTTKINYTMHSASALLYTLATAHWILGIVQLREAFIDHGSTLFGPALYYSNSSNTSSLVRVSLYVACWVIVDLLLVYRLFLLFERNFWIAIPPLICTMVFVIGYIMVIIRCANAGQLWYTDVLPKGSIGRYLVLLYASSLIGSFYPSALIVYQIVKKHMNKSQTSTTRRVFWPVIHTVVESAIFYSILSCAVMILYLKQSGFILLLLSINPQLIQGINFSLILLRISILSAERTKRISRTTFSAHRTSHVSFSVQSYDFKASEPADVGSLEAIGSQEHQPIYQSEISSTKASSSGTLKSEAVANSTLGVRGRATSLSFQEPAQASRRSLPAGPGPQAKAELAPMT